MNLKLRFWIFYVLLVLGFMYQARAQTNTIQLIRLRQPIGAFQFAIIGPPGAYTVLSSTNLVDWTVLGFSTTAMGRLLSHRRNAPIYPQKFYRAVLQTP